jgi:hypothetical protein
VVDDVRVEVVEQARREGHCDALSHARDSGPGNVLLELLGLLVHLVADDGANGSADNSADDRAASG